MDKDEVQLVEYKAADGLEMLRRAGINNPDAELGAKEAEESGRAFSVLYNGELVCCAGLQHKAEGRAIAWMLLPPDIGNYHIDPRICRDKIGELMEKFNYRRVEATVREDFPVGLSYMRWLGFKVEGRLEGYEQDGTNAFIFARVKK